MDRQHSVKMSVVIDRTLWEEFVIKVTKEEGPRKQSAVIVRMIKEWIEK